MAVDLEKLEDTIGGTWDLTVAIPKLKRVEEFTSVVFKLDTIHEVTRVKGKYEDRDSLIARQRKGGIFLVQICLQEFTEMESGLKAAGIGYVETGDAYADGSPAWQFWEATRRKSRSQPRQSSTI